jgi:arabinose-5-phosphate isomerase
MTDVNAYLNMANEALALEAAAITAAAAKLGADFTNSCREILACKGKVVVTGLGKSGHIARKIAATMASTGTPALYLHPAEALHGDLGVLQERDVLIAIAFGGETDEVLSVARCARRLEIKVIALTGKKDSSLAKLSDYILDGSVEREVCPHNLAPTSSTTVALALGDALAITLMRARGFSETDFARLHPSGALGRKLATVEDLMKKSGVELPVVTPEASFHEVLEAVTRKNYGIVPVVSGNGKIAGAISDGDIRRVLLKNGADALKLTASGFMSPGPKLITSSKLAIEAFRKMESAQITSLFVETTEGSGVLAGIVRMHDLLAAKIV